MSNARRAASILAAVACVGLAGSACTPRQRIHAETEVAKALISDEQLNQLGERMHRQLETQGVEFLQDPEVKRYVEEVAGKVFEEASEKRPGVDWHVHVVEDRKTVNAFATPGGHVYITTGALLAMDNEAELAGVLAHEAGHVAAYHPSRRLIAALGLQTVAQLALGEDANTLAALGASIAQQGLLLAHSRQDELEADRFGVRLSAQAGYNPVGLVSFFEELRQRQGDISGPLTFLMTHPAPKERIDAARRLIEEDDLSGGTVDRTQFQEVTSRLRGAS